MRVIVATDGTLDPERAAELVAPLAGNDPVSVLTVVEVNRALLRDLRAIYGERRPPATDQDAEYVGMKRDGTSAISPDWPGDDAMLSAYLDQQRERRTAPLEAALRKQGLEVAVSVREGEDAASGILAEIEARGCDVVVVGSRGSGVFDGLLGSTGTKMARRAPCPVLIIRP